MNSADEEYPFGDAALKAMEVMNASEKGKYFWVRGILSQQERGAMMRKVRATGKRFRVVGVDYDKGDIWMQRSSFDDTRKYEPYQA